MSKASPRLKYANEISAYTSCPPPECNGSTFVCYRFVHNPMASSDFLPLAMLEPTDDRCRCCKGWALSLYSSREGAKQRFQQIAKVARNFGKRTGGHLAEGTISDKTGLATEPDSTSHFSLFELEGIDLPALFNVIEKI